MSIDIVHFARQSVWYWTILKIETKLKSCYYYNQPILCSSKRNTVAHFSGVVLDGTSSHHNHAKNILILGYRISCDLSY